MKLQYFCTKTMDSINKLFGKNVTLIRQKKGITQAELAFLCHIHRAYMGVIERGEKSITLNTVEKIAQGLGVEPKELFNL